MASSIQSLILSVALMASIGHSYVLRNIPLTGCHFSSTSFSPMVNIESASKRNVKLSAAALKMALNGNEKVIEETFRIHKRFFT